MACYGKIARLPGAIRAQLNARLQRGDDGKNILAWLNSLPEVKSVLDAEFAGRPVTPQNLSDWRLGRFQEWLARQDILAQAEELAATRKDLDALCQGQSLADHLALVIAFRFAAILAGQGAELDEKSLRQLNALRPISQVVVNLRRGDHNAARLRIESQRWDLARQEALAAEEVSRKFNERMQIAIANRPSVKTPQAQALKGRLGDALSGLDELEKLLDCEGYATPRSKKSSRPNSPSKPPRPSNRPRKAPQTKPPPAPPTTAPAAASPAPPNPAPAPQAGPGEKPLAILYPKLAAVMSKKGFAQMRQSSAAFPSSVALAKEEARQEANGGGEAGSPVQSCPIVSNRT
ncbi:MAG: hypothetical protein ABSA47_05735 [Verrucomicrobiota bacterium]|jgi:hypothetical protein